MLQLDQPLDVPARHPGRAGKLGVVEQLLFAQAAVAATESCVRRTIGVQRSCTGVLFSSHHSISPTTANKGRIRLRDRRWRRPDRCECPATPGAPPGARRYR